MRTPRVGDVSVCTSPANVNRVAPDGGETGALISAGQASDPHDRAVTRTAPDAHALRGSVVPAAPTTGRLPWFVRDGTIAQSEKQIERQRRYEEDCNDDD
jgi:hypothetical protein